MNFIKRGFLKTAAKSVILVFLGCRGSILVPEIGTETYEISGDSVIVTLSKVPELGEIGRAVALTEPEYDLNMIIARVGESDFVIVSSRCTHRKKVLTYDHASVSFRCGRGKSTFRLDGTVIKGPAENSLVVYSYSLEEDRLKIYWKKCGKTFKTTCH